MDTVPILAFFFPLLKIESALQRIALRLPYID